MDSRKHTNCDLYTVRIRGIEIIVNANVLKDVLKQNFLFLLDTFTLCITMMVYWIIRCHFKLKTERR